LPKKSSNMHGRKKRREVGIATLSSVMFEKKRTWGATVTPEGKVRAILHQKKRGVLAREEGETPHKGSRLLKREGEGVLWQSQRNEQKGGKGFQAREKGIPCSGGVKGGGGGAWRILPSIHGGGGGVSQGTKRRRDCMSPSFIIPQCPSNRKRGV